MQTSDLAVQQLKKLLDQAVLCGTRGQAKEQDRCVAPDESWEWVIFTDDLTLRSKVRTLLHSVAVGLGKAAQIQRRCGGFATLRIPVVRFSIELAAVDRQRRFKETWELQERGFSKKQAWAKLNANPQQ